MIDSSTKRLMPALIVVLIIGLSGSFYLYLGARDDLTRAIQENSATQLQLSQLSNNYSQLSEQVQSLSISGEGEVRNVILLIGERIRLTPPARAVEHSPASRLLHA